MFIFPRVSGSDDRPEGEYPECEKIIRIGESMCPYCLHDLSEGETSSLERQASELNKVSESYEKLWFVALAAIVVTTLYFAL